MMAGAHIDEETLVSVAEHGVKQDTYPHLDECDDCRASVEQYRAVVLSLADESSWDLHPLDETPNPQTIVNLRAYVEQMQREDAEAEPLLAELLAGPREEWMPRLRADAKYRTAGVVRKLIAATHRAAEESPKDYVEIAKLAVEVGDHLGTASYKVEEVYRLRGGAYRERSYSLYLAGDIDASLQAKDRALAHFRLVQSADYDIGRLDILAATIYWRLDRVAEALDACEAAEQRFRAAGDLRRVAHGLIVKANVLAQARRFREALDVTSRVTAEFDEFLDEHARASVRCNEGFYLRELNEPLKAIERLQDAAFIFDSIGARASAVRVELNVAALLQTTGNLPAAADRLSRVMLEFEGLGMYSTAALAAVYLAENRAAEGRFEDVERLCAYAMTQAQVSPTAYRERALTALALLREASVQRRASPKLLHRVRRYLERLPYELPRVSQQPVQHPVLNSG